VVAVEQRDLLAVLMVGDTYPDPGDVLGFLRPRWHGHAACAGSALDFFPKRGEPDEPATSICKGCSVRRRCLGEAFARREEDGIWGGSTESLRRAGRRYGWSLAELDARVEAAE
jgi:WhiB family transcriptional regulator, redox-sensing transcriptional regulator